MPGLRDLFLMQKSFPSAGADFAGAGGGGRKKEKQHMDDVAILLTLLLPLKSVKNKYYPT